MGLGHLTHRGILFPSLGALRSWQSRFDVYSEVTRGPEIWQLGYRRCQVYTRRYGGGVSTLPRRHNASLHLGSWGNGLSPLQP